MNGSMAVVTNYSFDNPQVNLFSTYEEYVEYIQRVSAEEFSADKENGWDTEIKTLSPAHVRLVAHFDDHDDVTEFIVAGDVISAPVFAKDVQRAKTVCGDILTPLQCAPSQRVIVCHQTNCHGVMGAGLARQIKQRFPVVFQQYAAVCEGAEQVCDKSALLGSVHIVTTDAGYSVANCFGQDNFGRNGCYTDYDALRCCFRYLAEAFPDAIIRIPYKMGCGLAGGDWETVLRLIHDELCDKGVAVEIWRLQESVKKGA